MATRAFLRPTREDEVADVIADAVRTGERLVLAGGASKAGTGAPTSARVLELGGLGGVIDYDPAELVLTVRAGTRLVEVEALVAGQNQMLAFEPFDHGPVFGGEAGQATIGGVVAAGVAGSQRLSAGGARDHLLGFRAISGRAEAFKAGGKVVKNVTGFDVPKLAAGSWGRLFAMTELTLRLLPRPQVRATQAIFGLTPDQAIAAMAAALGSQAEIAAAAHIPATLADGASVTALRLQGFGPSVRARQAMLGEVLAPFGRVEPLAERADTFWAGFASLRALGTDRPLWRVNVPPSGSAAVIAAIERLDADWLVDWGGGLIWIAGNDDVGAIRGAAERGDGHATLVRGPATLRAAVSAFHPQPAGVAALESRIRRAFDPAGVFETGRF